MNTYLVPVDEGAGPYIKKIIANSQRLAEEKLYTYFFDKYEEIEGDTLKEIKAPLLALGIKFGQISDIEGF